jgi:hypothetical protein
MIDPSTAAVNVVMITPGTTADSAQNSRPFKTTENNPSVRRLIGSVTSLRIGLISVFIKPRHAPAIMEVKNPDTVIPGTKYAVTQIPAESNNQCIINFMKIGLRH